MLQNSLVFPSEFYEISKITFLQNYFSGASEMSFGTDKTRSKFLHK